MASHSEKNDTCRVVNRGRRRTIYPFKIKQTLSAQKTVNITKNGQIVKTINVRRKSKYFSGKNRLIFLFFKHIFFI